jgi:hypothetical protein
MNKLLLACLLLLSVNTSYCQLGNLAGELSMSKKDKIYRHMDNNRFTKAFEMINAKLKEEPTNKEFQDLYLECVKKWSIIEPLPTTEEWEAKYKEFNEKFTQNKNNQFYFTPMMYKVKNITNGEPGSTQEIQKRISSLTELKKQLATFELDNGRSEESKKVLDKINSGLSDAEYAKKADSKQQTQDAEIAKFTAAFLKMKADALTLSDDDKMEIKVYQKTLQKDNSNFKINSSSNYMKPVINRMTLKDYNANFSGIDTKLAFEEEIVVDEEIARRKKISQEAEAARRAEGREKLIKKFGKVNGESILQGKVLMGMTKEMVKAALGSPSNETETSSGYSSWTYYASDINGNYYSYTIYTFDKNIVVGISK